MKRCSEGRLDAAFDEAFVELGQFAGGFESDGDVVIAKNRLMLAAHEESEGAPAFGKFGGRDGVLGGVGLRLEIVNAELIEITKHDIPGTIGIKVPPIILGLLKMLLEIFAALFHFDEHDGFPYQIGEGSAGPVSLRHAASPRSAARFLDAALAERLKEAVEEDLRLTFFVAGNMLGRPVDKLGELGYLIHVPSGKLTLWSRIRMLCKGKERGCCLTKIFNCTRHQEFTRYGLLSR